MKKLFKSPAQILTLNTNGKNVLRGRRMQNVGLITEHSIAVEDGIITEIIPNRNLARRKFDEIIDLSGKTLLPGFVECHTHTLFAGSRASEFRDKLSGVSYEQTARKGGGINTTVKAVREANIDELISIVSPRIDYFISQGITSLEIKSGYGLNFYDEIKMLQTIKKLDSIYPIDIYATFLGAHTFPPEYKNDRKKYIEIIINEMLPFIEERNLAASCDAFCETTAFSAEEVDSIFTAAERHGLKIKIHTEQFNSIGGLETALAHNALSVDHLEVLAENQIEQIAVTDTAAVLLPGVSFFLDYNFAPARALIDSNAIVALATDYNPGSSHIANLNLIMSIASLKMGMSIEETITAATINSAKALGISDKFGSIEIGKSADFAVLDSRDYSDIVYQVGKNINFMTIKNGEIIYDKSRG